MISQQTRNNTNNNSAMDDGCGGGEQQRPVLASRYKTKMCRNYVITGMCPYEIRCMFAHGEHELRTMEMNLKDGLVTEEAIKQFNRSQKFSTATTVPLSPPAPTKKINSPSKYLHNPYSATCVYTYVYDGFPPPPSYDFDASATPIKTKRESVLVLEP